jgi:1-acyl-sn-glycerol-3-phosphate acyltransferase
MTFGGELVAGLIRLVTGARARWAGLAPAPDSGPTPKRIYFANHTSNLDAPVIWASLPAELRRKTRPVAARDYWDGGGIRRWLATRIFRVVLIERKNVTARTNPLASMEAALDAGESLILFPEGGRGTDDDGEMNDFKPGLWHLARKHPDAELVPVYLENLNRILPKGDFLLIPLQAAVTFGAPIKPLEGEEKPVFLARARDAVAALARRGEAQ